MLEYRVLGAVSATRDGEPVDLNRPLERRLLAILLVSRSRSLSDDQIFHALWPDGLPEYPGQALRTSVSRLRRMLGAGDVIVRHAGGYRLVVEPGSVDADRFEALVASRDSADRAVRLREALDLWTSDEAYADFRYHGFAEAEADRLQSLRLNACEELFAQRLASGESEELVPDLQSLVRENPLRERLYGLLMLALYRAGRQPEALRAFQVARDSLGRLGLEPSQDLVDLEERILLQDPVLDLRPPPSANNLPGRITSIVGRDAAIETLVKHLRDSRLVTVTGPGGVGKTTVATEAARSVVAEGQTECWYLDLASVTSSNQLLAYVTDELALLLQQPPDYGSQGYLASQLIGARQMLLVMDNCEHVIEEVGNVVGSILKDCPNAAVLATSRERLGLIGELVFPVDPLFAGDAGDAVLNPHEARKAYPALELLIDRCEAASPGFRLLPEDVPTALRLCRRLDGLPLAIELAAAQTASLSIADLERQIDGHLSILGTQRGVAARHRTLEAAIGWSYNLLDQQQQEYLQLLARVNGPFTIAEVAHLAAGGDETQAAATIAQLRDKSLVRATVEISRTTQFEMLMTIREFARFRAAEAGKDHEHELRHAGCFLAMAQRAGPHLLGGGPLQMQWMTRCTQSTTDLLQATQTLLANDSVEEAIDLVAHVGVAWTRYQIHLEAYPIICNAFEAAGDVVVDSTPRAQVLAAWMSPDVPGRPFRDGLEHAREALRTATIIGDPESAIAATAFIGLNQWLRGHTDEALDAVREACRLADREDRSWAETTAFIIAGIVEQALDPTQPAHQYFERAVDSSRARSDEAGEANALGYLGSALKDTGQYSHAGAAFHQAHLSGRRVGDPTVAIAGASGLALVAWLDGDPDLALPAGSQALELLSGLTPGAQHGALNQLFLAPEPTYTLSELEEGLSSIYAEPPGERAPAFIRFLLELAESRAASYLDTARVSEIRAGLAELDDWLNT